MSILDAIASRFGYIKARRGEYPNWAMLDAGAARDYMPSLELPKAQEELYQRLSWVYLAVSLTAKTAATAALSVLRTRADEEPEDIPVHPFELLLQRPNPLDSRFDFLVATYSFLQLTGDAFWWLTPPKGQPSELWIIPSHQLEPLPDGRMYLAGYEYDPGTGSKIKIPVEEIIHFRTFHPLNRFRGLSPIEGLARVAVGAEAMERWNTNYFDKQNAKMPGALAFADPIEKGEWERLKHEVQEEYGGTRRHLMMLRGVGQGAVSWISMAMAQKDMEFIAGQQFSKEQILQVFGVPPGMLDKSATEANAQAAKAVFSEYTIWPLLVDCAETITTKLLPRYGTNLIAQFEDPRKSDRAMDLQEQFEYSRTHTIDEIRQGKYGDKPLGDERGRMLLAEIAPGILLELIRPKPESEPQSVMEKPTQMQRSDNGHDGGEVGPTDEEQTDEETASNEQVKAELGRWQAKALNRLRRGKPAACEFVSDAIPQEMTDDVLDGLKASISTDDVRALFAGLRAARLIPDGAEEPATPLPAEVVISESDIERAVADWDRLMPEFAGLLEAEVVRKESPVDAQ